MPLYLSRIATVVSLQQLAEDASSVPPAGRVLPPEASVSECAGASLARYSFPTAGQAKAARTGSAQSFARVPNMDESSVSGGSDDEALSDGSVLEPGMVPHKSLLDAMLLTLWEDAAEQGLFRYDVTACQTKIVPGVYGFIAQLNEGRATKKRATEFRIDQVCQPFDGSKFNFTKAYLREVLFQFEPGSVDTPRFDESVVCGSSPNLVVINVSPIEYGHVLLVPRVLDCLPQLVDPSTVLLAMRFAQEAANPYFRVGYNSLGAYATINHLHFQAYYLAAPFPVERASTTLLKGFKRYRNLHLLRLLEYPVRAFVVEVTKSLEDVATLVGQACIRLQEQNIPHNLLIADSGKRVFLFPQCFAEKQARGLVPEELLETGVNPACWEIAGHMVLKRCEDYDTISQDLAWRLLEEVSLDEQQFQKVARLCFGSPSVESAEAVEADAALQQVPCMSRA